MQIKDAGGSCQSEIWKNKVQKVRIKGFASEEKTIVMK
jgi:hypothetical protein